MTQDQIKHINTLINESVVTLNGLQANVYPLEDKILISNNSFEPDINWEDVVVDYETFITTIKEENGRFCK